MSPSGRAIIQIDIAPGETWGVLRARIERTISEAAELHRSCCEPFDSKNLRVHLVDCSDPSCPDRYTIQLRS